MTEIRGELAEMFLEAIQNGHHGLAWHGMSEEMLKLILDEEIHQESKRNVEPSKLGRGRKERTNSKWTKRKS